MVQDEQEKWDIVIKPRSGLFRLDLEEVWLYRDLLVMYILSLIHISEPTRH